MGRMSKKDIEELREFLSLGCEFSGTEEIVEEITEEVLKSLGKPYFSDEVALYVIENEDICTLDTTLDTFVGEFWERAVEKILNVVATQGR